MNTGLSRKLLRLTIGGAVIVSLIAFLKPATSESEAVQSFNGPVSAEKGGGCSAEHWPNFSPNCLQSAEDAPVRRVWATATSGPMPPDPDVVIPTAKAPSYVSALDAFAQMPANAAGWKRMSRTRAVQERAREQVSASTSPILYGQ